MERLIRRTNDVLVNKFLLFLREGKQISPESAERYRFYWRVLLLWAMDVLLNKAHTIRPTFPAYVAALTSPRGGPLAAETQKKIIEIARQFFEWARLNHTSEFRAISACLDRTAAPGAPEAGPGAGRACLCDRRGSHLPGHPAG